MWVAGVTQEPPRRTIWRGHELAVVLAEGAGEGLVAGVAGVAGGGPLPDVAEDLLEAGEVGAGVGWRLPVRGGWRWIGLRADVGRRCSGDGCEDGRRRSMRAAVAACSHSNSVGVEDRAGAGDPAGVGVGLEEAEVADGGLGEVFEGEEAVEGVDATSRSGWRGRAASRAGPASLRRACVVQPSESQSSGRV